MIDTLPDVFQVEVDFGEVVAFQLNDTKALVQLLGQAVNKPLVDASSVGQRLGKAPSAVVRLDSFPVVAFALRLGHVLSGRLTACCSLFLL